MVISESLKEEIERGKEARKATQHMIELTLLNITDDKLNTLLEKGLVLTPNKFTFLSQRALLIRAKALSLHRKGIAIKEDAVIAHFVDILIDKIDVFNNHLLYWEPDERN